MKDKFASLQRLLVDMGSVAVAYSGGIDSTLLLKLPTTLWAITAAGLTAVSPSVPAHEVAEAQEIARLIGARHILLETSETEDERYLANTPDRCYFCKSEHWTVGCRLPWRKATAYLVDGNNADDVGDHPPAQTARQARRAQPAPGDRHHQGGDPCHGADVRAAELGQTLRRLPLFAHPVRHDDHRADAVAG